MFFKKGADVFPKASKSFLKEGLPFQRKVVSCSLRIVKIEENICLRYALEI